MKISIKGIFSLIAICGVVWLWLLIVAYYFHHEGSPSKTTVDIGIKQSNRTTVDASRADNLKHRLHRHRTSYNDSGRSSLNQKNWKRRGKSNFTDGSYYGPLPPLTSTPWIAFVRLSPSPSLRNEFDVSQSEYNVCSAELVRNVTRPMLSPEAYEFCSWALKSSSEGGGSVKVGSSYGTLNSEQRDKYEKYYCNSVANGGRNPSCDDAFGDEQIRSWRSSPVEGNLCRDDADDANYTSNVRCFNSRSNARFCVFDNAMLNFSRMHNVHRVATTDSRKWDKDFLTAHCSPRIDIKYYNFYTPTVSDLSSTKCDYVFRETVLVMSHDQIKNLGHTMNDFMQVWAMLWLSGTAATAKHITLLNIDALREGHNYQDSLFQFGTTYAKAFGSVIKASQFPPTSSACFKRLIFLPRPYLLFTWDGWWQDIPCTRVGPSSLFQRWNLQVREAYGGLLDAPKGKGTRDVLHVLLVLRLTRTKEEQGDYKAASRVFANTEEIVATLRGVLRAFSDTSGVATKLSVINLADLVYEDQVRLLSTVSVVVGVHGAGITHSMHMPLGTNFCCGVIEIFPEGEFTAIRGHGNMARRMGHVYDRIDLHVNGVRQNHEVSAYVPPAILNKTFSGVLSAILRKPSCILPTVFSDPFFDESLPAVWG